MCCMHQVLSVSYFCFLLFSPPFVFLFVWLFLCLLSLQNFDVSKIINEQGCLEAAEDWIEKNMLSIASYTFILLFFQVSLCFYLFALHFCVKCLKEKIFVKVMPPFIYIDLFRYWASVLRRTYAPTSLRRRPSGTDNCGLPPLCSTVCPVA